MSESLTGRPQNEASDDVKQHLQEQFDKLAAVGAIDSVVPPELPEQKWIISCNGQILEFTTDNALDFLMGARVMAEWFGSQSTRFSR